MTDNQGGVQGIDPAALPAGFFAPAPAPAAPQDDFLELRLPASLQAFLAFVPQPDGTMGMMLNVIEGSTLSKEVIGNMLHSLSHQILSEVEEGKANV